MVLDQLGDYSEGISVYIELTLCELDEQSMGKSKFRVMIQSPEHIKGDIHHDEWLFIWWNGDNKKKLRYCEVNELEELIDKEIGNLPRIQYEWLEVVGKKDNHKHVYKVEEWRLWEMECKGESWKDLVLDIMSDMNYIFNRGRYARTKRAPLTV